MHSCNLPPALLAEWPRSFTCHCGNTGVERTPNKSQHTKLTLEKKILPPLLPGFKLATFQSGVWRSNQQAIPPPLTRTQNPTAMCPGITTELFILHHYPDFHDEGFTGSTGSKTWTFSIHLLAYIALTPKTLPLNLKRTCFFLNTSESMSGITTLKHSQKMLALMIQTGQWPRGCQPHHMHHHMSSKDTWENA